jgi:hypothetical protein
MPDDQAQEKSPEFHPEVAEAAVKMAELEAQKGVYETSNDNRGPRVDEYQMVNNTLGQWWCAKFAYWCFMQAALQMRVANPFPRIFGARELEKWGIKERRMVTDPMRGDVLVQTHHHVGLVTGHIFEKKNILVVSSVEGNTWTGRVRRDGVYALEKQLVANCTFIRL